MFDIINKHRHATLDITTATGDELDKIAEMFGIKRHKAVSPTGDPVVETDEDVRRRVRSFALGGDGHVIDPYDIVIKADGGIEYIPISIEIDNGKPKCECGAASTGYGEPGNWHSSWCPLYKG